MTQLNPRTRICPHCSGRLLVDPDDALAFKCSECSRSPAPERVELLEGLSTARNTRHSLTGRSDRPGAGTIPTGVSLPFRNYRR